MELGFGIIVGCVIFMAIKLQKIDSKLNTFHENWLNQENRIHHLPDDMKRDIKRSKGK
ncbi:MAG: hypothetical protein ACJZ16_04800 [Methylophilaceae bacterium]